jgi:tRNA A22 N-methylase
LPYNSIDISGFELINGRPPRTSFDWNTPEAATVQERLNQDKAKAIATRIYKAIDKAKSIMAKTQEKKSKDVNAYYRKINFGEGNQVWILTKN